MVPASAQAHGHLVLDRASATYPHPDQPAHLHTADVWDGRYSPRSHLHPRVTGQQLLQLLWLLPLLSHPPSHLISHLVMSPSPGETGSHPESQPQKKQATAPPWSRLLPSATLQLRAALSLSLGLPPAERLAFRQRMEKHQGNHLLSSLGAEIHSGKESQVRGGVQAKTPTGGWDGVLGTQRPRPCSRAAGLGAGSSWMAPTLQLPPLLSSNLFQNVPSPRYCVCGKTGWEGPGRAGE